MSCPVLWKVGDKVKFTDDFCSGVGVITWCDEDLSCGPRLVLYAVKVEKHILFVHSHPIEDGGEYEVYHCEIKGASV